ncbi:GGDEF domain-containing phosphodiesterase [Gymnodinialimonas ulvae]|uniref:GGDEF domain-containing phosphodiesterase n=1 Tax=Gymnodinialimonas ulvae TaxID=3126504 RepID=UPI0030A591F0
MARPQIAITQWIGQRAQSGLGRIEVLALFPLIVLTADWFGFDNIALVTAVGLSALLACAVILPARRTVPAAKADTRIGKAGLQEALDAVTAADGRDTVCLMVEIDAWADIISTWGFDAALGIAQRTEDRLRTALRSADILCKLGDARFGIVLASMPAARLGIRDTITERLSQVTQDPLPVNGAVLRISVGIGHSSLRRRAANPADATLKAAEAALTEAQCHGPGSIRAYADGMGRARSAASQLSTEVEDALQSGAIDIWYQPQICAQTEAVTGVAAIPFWDHPKHGRLSPAEMEAALRASGQMGQLGRTMIHCATKALGGFDAAGARVPAVSIGLSRDDLQDAQLIDTLNAEAVRYGLAHNRIAIEVTAETIAHNADDTTVANLAALKANGHRIDLTTPNSAAVPLLALQRFRVDRLKIDHALVLGLQTDPKKDQALRATIALASAMTMQTIATGVETRDETAHLARLGCDHVQGFGVARPMRADQLADWVRARDAAGKPIRLDDRRMG